MAQFVDPSDLDKWLDVGQMASPQDSKRAQMPQAPTAMTSPLSAYQSVDFTEEQQRSMQPSHDYASFKQQTGLPTQVDHLRVLGAPQGFPNYNTGIYENQMWSGMAVPSVLGASPADANIDALLDSFNDDIIDPTALQKHEEAQAQVRFYPGMHQQAAMAEQMRREKQKQREAEQQRAQASRRQNSHQPIDQRTEETISRVMSEIRRSSTIAADSLSPTSPGGLLPHIIRAKKDEEEMDEDERLLNSEEGKKLSSKERRQLRNKVSARAFRSRRKEYIGQLEGEVAAKANECNDLKRQNTALMEENARFRSLAEKLLAHPAFHPFLEDLSRDPSLAESLSKVTGNMSTPSNMGQMSKDLDPYNSSQQFAPPPHSGDTTVGMTLIPEVPLDLSALTLATGATWNLPVGRTQQPMNYQQSQVFAVTELPVGPADPLDFSAALSGKGTEVETSFTETEEAEKATAPLCHDVPEVEEPVQELPVFDENDETMCLFTNAAPNETVAVVDEPEVFEPILGEIAPEKAFAHFELFVSSEEDNALLLNHFERMIARLDKSCRRLESLVFE